MPRTYHASAMLANGRSLGERKITSTSHANAKATTRRWARSLGAECWSLEGPSNTAPDAWATGQVR